MVSDIVTPPAIDCFDWQSGKSDVSRSEVKGGICCKL